MKALTHHDERDHKKREEAAFRIVHQKLYRVSEHTVEMKLAVSFS
jgi:hypothetical protein